MSIEVTQGDITQVEVEAIVNAANTALLGGGGVDGAIHRAAGPELLKECRAIGGCPTGKACITKGYNLKTQYIIHTVGPVWSGGTHGEGNLLADCYRNCLLSADENDIASVAFPSISTGAFRFPMDHAANIAVREIREFIVNAKRIKRVLLCCLGQKSLRIHTAAIAA